MSSRSFAAAFALVVLGFAGCNTVPNADLVIRPAQDTTPPSALWLQADLPNRPLANAFLAGTGSVMQLGEPGMLALKVTGTDGDGGVRAVRIFFSSARSTGSTVQGHGLIGAPAIETTSSAAVGQPAPRNLNATHHVDTVALIGGFNDLEIKAWAEVENFSGVVARTATITIPVRLVKLRLHALALTDIDGAFATNATAAGFATMVQRLNRRFEGTMIRFLFDAATDWQGYGSTSLNRDAADQRTIGNSLADTLAAGKILILLRWGKDVSAPTGNSNAYPPTGIAPSHTDWNTVDQRYVAMAGRLDVGVSSHLNLGWGNHFAHEIGHYLGLYHTFPGFSAELVFSGTVPAAGSTQAQDAGNALVRFAASHGGGVGAFDGDGLVDTPPDPNPIIYNILSHNICSGADLSVTGTKLDGTSSTLVFHPDPENVMSYFRSCNREPDGTDSPQGFTRQQISRMHQALHLPERIHLLR